MRAGPEYCSPSPFRAVRAKTTRNIPGTVSVSAFMRLAVAIASILLVAGCGLGPEDRVIGIWRADSTISDIPAIPIPGFEDKARQAFSTIQLQLRSDMTYLLVIGKSTDGKWRLEGDTVYLTPTTAGGDDSLHNLSAHFREAVVSPDSQNLKFTIETPLGNYALGMKKTG
jgi:hypothetical protein